MTLAWQVLSTYGAAIGLVFLITYTRLARWWRYPEGWNVATLAAGLTLAFSLVSLQTWLGDLDPLVMFGSVFLIAAAMTHRTYLLVREHRRGRPVRTSATPTVAAPYAWPDRPFTE